eukprot:gnl/TRDRNA2_/TRDRNA2_63413_c0_seq2.p1 gnl/TRDRNA2_/TRDRNA2_63413_c0~~gnl/TRDRNA2_/TRDRNA2_63413_c0_seq2.p1  ORF type:complete len:377 (-),score=80.62 gnl/TRDRNA2_/TRDRNA2_63413_c0_seq2:168-1298(-)
MLPAPPNVSPCHHAHALVSAAHDIRCIRDVWAWNFEEEFNLLVAAATSKHGAVLALDTEFPGFLREEPRWSTASAARYEALRANVDLLQPIQFGIAAASASDGSLLGTWSFNLHFDLATDLHTDASVNFLKAAGIDFPRHALEGIASTALGRRLAQSPLVGKRSDVPRWITFSGEYDLAYMLKLLTGTSLPRDAEAFDEAIATFCPRRNELRERLLYGSLESAAMDHGIKRRGSSHTAGSDALVYLSVVPIAERAADACAAAAAWATEAAAMAVAAAQQAAAASASAAAAARSSCTSPAAPEIEIRQTTRHDPAEVQPQSPLSSPHSDVAAKSEVSEWTTNVEESTASSMNTATAAVSPWLLAARKAAAEAAAMAA